MMNNIKTVNVQPTLPIRNLRTPITQMAKNIKLSTGDIFKCLCARAFVDEVLSDGSLVRLNFANYNKNNEKIMPIDTVEPEAVEPLTEEPVNDESTVIVDDTTTDTVADEATDPIVVEDQPTVLSEDDPNIAAVEAEEVQDVIEAPTDTTEEAVEIKDTTTTSTSKKKRK